MATKLDCTTTVPRLVWTFWNSDSVPSDALECVAQWKRILGPSWSVTVVTNSTLQKHVGEVSYNKWIGPHRSRFEKLAPNIQSDFVRLLLLWTHGGVWLDIHSALIEDFAWVDETFQTKTASVQRDILTPIRAYGTTRLCWESYFIACPARSKSIDILLTQLHRVVLLQKPSDYAPIETDIFPLYRDYHVVYFIWMYCLFCEPHIQQQYSLYMPTRSEVGYMFTPVCAARFKQLVHRQNDRRLKQEVSRMVYQSKVIKWTAWHRNRASEFPVLDRLGSESMLSSTGNFVTNQLRRWDKLMVSLVYTSKHSSRM